MEKLGEFMGDTVSEPLLLELVKKIQQILDTTTPRVLFRIYEKPDGDVHWSIIIQKDKTSIILTKEGPSQIRKLIFEGTAEDFAAKAFEVFPLKELEELPARMEFWLHS